MKAFRSKDMFGDQLYQQRAREALPILVRQAKAQQTITYESLAEELRMPNPRNLNYVLGSITRTLLGIQLPSGVPIPPLTVIVVNKATGIPGEGVSTFLENMDYTNLTTKQLKAATNGYLSKTWFFPYWDDVLVHLDLHKPSPVNRPALEQSMNRGIGESENHKQFKEFIAVNPQIIGLRARPQEILLEHKFPSGDIVDILFIYEKEWVAVEVKSHLSDEADIYRGLFQCVKYSALTEASLKTIDGQQSYRSILALESHLPDSLIPMRNVLGITVRDCLSDANK